MSEVDISSLKEVIVLQADQEGIRLVAISSHPLREDEQEEMEVVLTDVLSDFPDVGEVDIEYRLDSEAPEEGVRAWPEV